MNSRVYWVVATAVITAGCVEVLNHYFGRHGLRQVSKEAAAAPGGLVALSQRKGETPEELILEQLSRNYSFLSPAGMARVRGLSVTIVGVGGVGSHVATQLVRAGVSNLRLIDFDQVSLSSLNRHSVATLADVGVSKVEVLKTHSLQVAPWAQITAINSLWTLDKADLLGTPDYVIDCIDNIDTKVDLLAYCTQNGIAVVSSGGAGCKSDPTRINIGDLSTTEEDPLCRAVRRRLKKLGISSGVPTIFSAEKPDPRKAALLPLDSEEVAAGDVSELSPLQSFRVRILPVLGTMPGIFGLTIATFVLTTVGGYPLEPIEGKNRIKLYDGILQSLAGQQTRVGETDQRVPITMNDVRYLVEEVFRGKSPISGYSTRLTLSRWDPAKPPGVQNVVLMTKEEQHVHEQTVLNGGMSLALAYSEDVLAMVEKRFAEERYYDQYR